MINHISLSDYRRYNPGATAFRTDAFYAGTANQLLKRLGKCMGAADFSKDFSAELVIVVAHYFEDIVSDAGQWRAFIEVHQERYGRPLPFFDLSDIDEYFPDEIHHQDVQFLVWNMLQSSEDRTFLNPENPYIAEVAQQFADVLEERYDEAPVNEDLLDYLYGYDDVPNTDLPFWIKDRAGWLMMWNYVLSMSDGLDGLQKYIEPFEKTISKYDAYYAGFALFAIQASGGPLNMTGFELYAAICRNSEAPRSAEIASLIKNMQYRPTSVYKVTSVDESTITLLAIDGDTIQIAKDEFNPVGGSRIEKTLSSCPCFGGTLLKWDGRWMTWGMTTWLENDEQFRQMEEHRNAAKASASASLQAVRGKYGDQKLFFLKDIDALDDFRRGLFEKELPLMDEAGMSDFPRNTPVALLQDEESGAFSIIPGADAFHHSANPYFSAVDSAQKAFEMLMISPYIMDERTMDYLIDQGCFQDAACNSIYGRQRGHELVQDNIRFLNSYFMGM